jgi:uncharacterized glyoxalase superfamily protein PhnB
MELLLNAWSLDRVSIAGADRSLTLRRRKGGPNPATIHAGCYIITDEVDDWHARFVAAGPCVTAIEDMPWNMHEFTLTDPSSNYVRIGRSVSS